MTKFALSRSSLLSHLTSSECLVDLSVYYESLPDNSTLQLVYLLPCLFLFFSTRSPPRLSNFPSNATCRLKDKIRNNTRVTLLVGRAKMESSGGNNLLSGMRSKRMVNSLRRKGVTSSTFPSLVPGRMSNLSSPSDCHELMNSNAVIEH